MKKLNCWEYFACGREPGGSKAEESGICPVTIDERLDGVNGGVNGGRACWGVMELSGCSRREEPRPEASNCTDCSFRTKVILEEGFNYQGMRQIAETLDCFEGSTARKCCQTA